ncbi:hypothetical protein DVH24_030592 [Malus domestica]|uniref:TIR domain-containing protein n=1 Tax=Malus domestica TaxID=3750 RepID=A0A498K479_MALDO|nr:hypothetical protein DVH24_030592 [Malus domestica]
MAMSTQRASAPLLSLESAPRWKYDVFLSFRGVDTRKGFVSHLYHELCKFQGITTFLDDRELEEGTSIPLELPSAIKESHIAIVVLSPNYASSKWCLNELTTILQCMEARNSVLPVFYETDPSDVGNQRGSFAKAFAEHEEKFITTEDKKKVVQWKADLKRLSKISGWHSKQYKCESELIEKIVNSVRRKGTRAIEGIGLRLPEIEEVHWNCEAFSNMSGLRFLEFDNLIVSSNPKFLPCSLRIMNWSLYPSKSLPPSFHPRFLTELKMRDSKLVRLWDGKENFPNLKYIDLSISQKLISTPDFTGLRNLEKLFLMFCTNLVEVHPSIAVLKRLKVLELYYCKSIKSLPNELEMDSLERLDLMGCSKVKRIPEFSKQMKNLSNVSLGGTAIEKLPSTIGHLVGLTELRINNCRNLLDIPTEICNLKSLKRLCVKGSSKIEKLPGKMEFLEELDLGGNAIREPLVDMKSLKRLHACGSIGKPRDEWGLLRLFGIRKSHEPCWGLVLCSLNHMRCLVDLQLRYGDFGEGDIPHDIGSLSSLVSLDLSGNNFVTLPISIKCLSQLQYLCLKDCERLEQLPDLPSNSLLYVIVDGCTSLKRLSDPSKLSSRFANIYDFTFSSRNCITLVEDEDWMNTIYSRIVKFAAKGICQYNYIVCPGNGIPEWFNNQTVGHSLNLELPPQSCSSWMGIAFCVVFAQRKGNPDALQYYGFEIQLSPEISFRIFGEEHLMSEHLWIFYLSREDCQEPFSFETCYDAGGCRLKVGLNMVKMCGARLVYKQDLEELNRTLTILKRTHGYCEEAAPSESGSFDDKEQAHKRQKEE